jgi:hypothetical protein
MGDGWEYIAGDHEWIVWSPDGFGPYHLDSTDDIDMASRRVIHFRSYYREDARQECVRLTGAQRAKIYFK